MKLIGNYLKENIKVYVMYVLFTGLTLVTIYLYELPQDLFLDITLFLTFVLVVYSLIEGYRYRQKIKQLQHLQERSLTLHSMAFFPKATQKNEQIYQELLQKLLQEKERQQQQTMEQQEIFLEDFGLWMHQIKTPIAALDLLVQSSEIDRKLMKNELFKINECLQLMLNYLRQNLSQEDLVIEKIQLEPVVKKVLKKYAIFFSQKNLRLVLKGLNITVYTDRKWLIFILEQVVFNAIKYTENGEIALCWENQLVIADTGMGIRPEDVPRVFEKGYTGYNGREQQRASGLGLYLCTIVAEKIGISLSLTSELGKGTKVMLDFPTEQNFNE